MPGSRVALTSIVWLGLVTSLLVHGCSDADEAPDNSVTGGTGGTGGVSGSGGIPGIDVKSDAPPACADPTDSDGDGIADEIEGPGDTDGDGIPDAQDLDSDGDGIPDSDEAANPLLPSGEPGKSRSDPCSPVADTDGDGTPDFQDLDSDGDGLPDADELAECGAAAACSVQVDCDGDGVVDIVEQAAGSSPCDKNDVSADAGLYFVVPYQAPEQSKKFDFSTGIKEADIQFLIDTTNSMQSAIDDIKASLDTKIIPTILNGDATAAPPIPAVPGAWIGIGAINDVPWDPWGVPGDEVYRHKFTIGASTTYGNVSAPVAIGASFKAPDNVKQILDTLSAAGGGDAPEATTQALWLASSQDAYQVGAGGLWVASAAQCDSAQMLGRACFRPGKLPIFVIVTDAAFHNGPTALFDYKAPPTGNVTGTRTYAEVITKLQQIGAKVVGVSVNTGLPGQARADLIDLAKKTGSEYFDPAFGGSVKPLVTSKDIAPNKDTGELSKEVVRLIGMLVGQGLNNVTTKTTSYDCPGNVDCTGDGSPDPEYHNLIDPLTQKPFDAASLITRVVPVPVATDPKPYSSIDATTFYGVRGDATVEFEVFARNEVLQPKKLTVVRALLRVQTPGGQALGGADGIKVIYLVIPPYAAVPS
jgi:hypothetical protein